jgi:hypothetical protein
VRLGASSANSDGRFSIFAVLIRADGRSAAAG